MSRMQLLLLLRILAVIDGRDREQLCVITGASRSTLTRYIATARRFGIMIEWRQDAGAYRLTDPGIFNVDRIRRLTA